MYSTNSLLKTSIWDRLVSLLTTAYLKNKISLSRQMNLETLWSADRTEVSVSVLTGTQLQHRAGAGENPSSRLHITSQAAHLSELVSHSGEGERQIHSSRSHRICICHSESMFSYYRADKVTAIINLTVYGAD